MANPAITSEKPALLRVTLEGDVEEVLTACDGEPLLFPNDLCFGPDGALYLTDSGIRFEDFAPGGQVRPDYMDVDLDGRKITKHASGVCRSSARTVTRCSFTFA